MTKYGKSSKGSGVGFNDATSDINKIAYAKTMRTVQLNDEYRKYCKENVRPLTFLDWKQQRNKLKKK